MFIIRYMPLLYSVRMELKAITFIFRSNRNIHTIPEEVEELIVENGKDSQKDNADSSLNELSDDEDDIENLLAPEAEIQKKE